MTVYRNDLRTYIPDEAVLSSRRVAVKDGAAIQRKRVYEAKASPTEQNIYIIKLLQNDLQALHEEICLVTQSGIPWTTGHFCAIGKNYMSGANTLQSCTKISLKLRNDQI